jgi:hypothetical protein
MTALARRLAPAAGRATARPARTCRHCNGHLLPDGTCSACWREAAPDRLGRLRQAQHRQAALLAADIRQAHMDATWERLLAKASR